MASSPLPTRLLRGTPLLLAVLIAWSAVSAHAAAGLELTLKPHCIIPDLSRCPSFAVNDAASVRTDPLTSGDILDIDVVLKNADALTVTTLRSWLQYDPKVLEARNLELMDALSEPLPDEQSIDQTRGLVKIGGGVDSSKMTAETVIARITFRVLASLPASSLQFYGYQPAGSGETSIASNGEGLLNVQPVSLALVFTQAAPSSLGFSVASAGASSIAPIPSARDHSAFALLQIQNVQVTTRDSSIFLAWDPLRSSELAGYNIYYGTVSGRYIQRRSIPSTTSSVIIRDLLPGTQYFLAVRGATERGIESTFSQEVSVVVGRPETATSPLTGRQVDEAPVDENPVTAHGGRDVGAETGVSTTIALLALLSALIGTFFAFRRQLHLPSHG